MNKSKSATLYDRLGGDTAIHEFAEKLYEHIAEDPELAAFFASATWQEQTEKMTAFLRALTQGSHPNPANHMRQAHAGALANGMGADHFVRVAAAADSTLAGMRVPEKERQEVMSQLSALQSAVLNQESG